MSHWLWALGLSLTPLGGEVGVQDGWFELRPSLDLLDVELQVREQRFVLRTGRLAVGALALEIADVELDWLYRPHHREGPHVPFWAAGVGMRVAGNAATWLVGPKALGRLGLAWQSPKRRIELFAELHVASELGPHLTAADAGLRLGVSLMWGR